MTTKTEITENNPMILDAETREQKIACLAYSMAEKRGFESGHEQEDWLEAEKVVDEAILSD